VGVFSDYTIGLLFFTLSAIAYDVMIAEWSIHCISKNGTVFETQCRTRNLAIANSLRSASHNSPSVEHNSRNNF